MPAAADSARAIRARHAARRRLLGESGVLLDRTGGGLGAARRLCAVPAACSAICAAPSAAVRAARGGARRSRRPAPRRRRTRSPPAPRLTSAARESISASVSLATRCAWAASPSSCSAALALGLHRVERLLRAGQPLGEASAASGASVEWPRASSTASSAPWASRSTVDCVSRTAAAALTHLLRGREQLLGVGRAGGRAGAQVGQLVAQVAQQPARLLVADGLHLHLLDARAEPARRASRVSSSSRRSRLPLTAFSPSSPTRSRSSSSSPRSRSSPSARPRSAASACSSASSFARRRGLLVGRPAALLLAGALDLL